jgi:hypothetical protein
MLFISSIYLSTSSIYNIESNLLWVKYSCYGISQLHCKSPFPLTVLYRVSDIVPVIPSRDISRVLDIVLASSLMEFP